MADFPFTRYWMMPHNPMADLFNEKVQKGLEQRKEGTFSETYVHALSLFFYDTEAGYRHIPYQLKYHGNLPVGRFFGKMLGSKLMEAGWVEDVDVVIPVPLHWTRKWKRGYNQAEVIASEVASTLGVPLRKDILRRNRSTKTQTKLSVDDKMSNVSGAFQARDTNETFSHILLVDDVFTTGATLYSCFETLRINFPYPVRISIATLGFVGG